MLTMGTGLMVTPSTMMIAMMRRRMMMVMIIVMLMIMVMVMVMMMMMMVMVVMMVIMLAQTMSGSLYMRPTTASRCSSQSCRGAP